MNKLIIKDEHFPKIFIPLNEDLLFKEAICHIDNRNLESYYYFENNLLINLPVILCKYLERMYRQFVA